MHVVILLSWALKLVGSKNLTFNQALVVVDIDSSLAMQCAHDGEVVGLACDATNGSLISSGYHGDI